MQIEQELKASGLNLSVPITKDDTLSFICQKIDQINAKSVLEIGTAIAYGCITMAKNTKLDYIDTLEIDEQRYALAKQNIAKQKLTKKINVYLIDAMQYIKTCNKKYDLIYLDGPKGQYINYLPYLVNLLNQDGVIIADNLYFHGMVTGEIPISKGCRAMIKGLKNYIKEVTTNPKYKTEILNIGDGVGVTSIKK